MATWSELLERLTECEKTKFMAERAAEARVRTAESKVTAVTQRFGELKRQQEQQKRELRVQCEKQLRDQAARTRKAILQAEADKVAAEGDADQAEDHMRHAVQHMEGLTAKVQQMQELLQEKTIAANQRAERAEREAQDRIDRVSAQVNQRVNDMSQLAKEVQEAAAACFEQVQQEHADQITRADNRAEGRRRFKELCGLSAMRSDMTISQTEFEGAKEDLMRTFSKSGVPGDAPSPRP